MKEVYSQIGEYCLSYAKIVLTRAMRVYSQIAEYCLSYAKIGNKSLPAKFNMFNMYQQQRKDIYSLPFQSFT